MTLIAYHLHKHKLLADSRMTYRQSTDAHQCHTLAALSIAYFKEAGHMPFLDQKSVRRYLLHTRRIS